MTTTEERVVRTGEQFTETMVEVIYGDVDEGPATGLWSFTHEPGLDVEEAIRAAAREYATWNKFGDLTEFADLLSETDLLAKHGLHETPRRGYVELPETIQAFFREDAEVGYVVAPVDDPEDIQGESWIREEMMTYADDLTETTGKPHAVFTIPADEMEEY